MRILTFGTLIVVIGTFAALPFRRYRANQEALPAAEATGPTRTTLGGLEFEALAADPSAQAELPALSLPTSSEWESPQRQLRMPLTYDDLAVPLTKRPEFDEKFSATATAQSAKKPNPNSGLTATQTRLQSTSVVSEAASPSTITGANSVLVADDQSASATATKTVGLVRSPVVQPIPQRKPQAEPVERHWIHQP